MKKEIIITASSVVATLLVKKVCENLFKKKNNQYEGKTINAYKLLDPFVMPMTNLVILGTNLEES